ncbi:SHD1-domain-containing protein [Coprinopsis marcescibilis]|uniref:SHD1-domain-containing protein n=1 Tax=Coprinopsis marcescibilis TaxID=230819 RepID=A0A5C3KUC4_COPMA|nr:SHD1-domain-containing protein [Coprinopsis marcescibilis]
MPKTPELNRYLAILKASYDYTPQYDDEIAVKGDQLLFLIERTYEDWWKVKVKGNGQDEGPVGLVPAAYVEQARHSSLMKAVYNYEPTHPGDLGIKEDDVLRLFESDGDWILAQSHSGDGVGYVPANYVEEFSEEQPTRAAPLTVMQDSVSFNSHNIVFTYTHFVLEQPPRPSSTYVDPAKQLVKKPVSSAPKSYTGPPPEPSKANGSSSSKTRDLIKPPAEKIRFWHDRTGQYRVEAALLGVFDGKLHLHKVNGVVVAVPTEKMFADDMRYVEKVMANSRKQRGINRTQAYTYH